MRKDSIFHRVTPYCFLKVRTRKILLLGFVIKLAMNNNISRLNVDLQILLRHINTNSIFYYLPPLHCILWKKKLKISNQMNRHLIVMYRHISNYISHPAILFPFKLIRNKKTQYHNLQKLITLLINIFLLNMLWEDVNTKESISQYSNKDKRKKGKNIQKRNAKFLKY